MEDDIKETYKQIINSNKKNLVEILAYIHTGDIELMSRITKSISIDQLENIVFE
ncbi:hypothetical protein N5U20_06220 [Aliarcobacter butzleri]|uniref:hypothetical protein n=1 Tax=Aliarcobacter butzleri TaxID=28197 RepID=UPI0021B1FEFF|nr:hypothetical protein [Aliarcobacter butzleri]MCT7557932.1 hypothetical protein [Aliarcobacter butzleri]MCT7612806.1 hypothetical protein [Aliarcobacter butzleri]MCT7641448.1 hypothetical protein [Aliarcobacter butzleri]